jgi:hypothetical protein
MHQVGAMFASIWEAQAQAEIGFDLQGGGEGLVG